MITQSWRQSMAQDTGIEQLRATGIRLPSRFREEECPTISPAVEHIALYVKDIDRMREFYMEAFRATAGKRFHSDRTGLVSESLTLKNGLRMKLMTLPHLLKADYASRTGWSHIAMGVRSEENVRSETERLRAMSGCRVLAEPHYTEDNCFESVISDPEGNRIVLTT
ncbi:MAG: VOC family protein [Clostridia bacterium]|nr:VOC family protein [Clostridia bacterium]MBQ8971643.1 VOC family protein [Clostridia bacterium]